jgi:chromosome segregation ATPase
MERFGYVKKELYEGAVRERDELKRRIGELEAKVSELEKERADLKITIGTFEAKVADLEKERDELKKKSKKIKKTA